ncbi:MAG: hypothetical protein K9L71_02675 [Candidatus Omnitrophica bacterium]|nr:hypothetical protein [Candidatus Omnitrophota bacterium]
MEKKYHIGLIILFFVVFFLVCLFVEPAQAERSKTHSNRYKVALEINKLAIFPFADHSYSSLSSVQQLNKGKEIVEYLREAFREKNIELVDTNSIERLFLAEGVIQTLKEADNPASYEWNILNSSYSHFAEERVIDDIIKRYDKTAVLSKSKVAFLTDMLGADAVVRGVILDKTPKNLIEEDSMLKPQTAAMAKRIIPFFIRGKFCYALTGSYETGLFPISHSRPPKIFPSFNSNAKVIEILIFIQNTKTGDIAWSGSRKISYSRKGSYFSGEFRTKLKKQVNLLIDDFISSLSKFKGSWVLIKK